MYMNDLHERLSKFERLDTLLYRPDGTLRSDLEIEVVLREARRLAEDQTTGAELPDQAAVDMVLATESTWLRNAKLAMTKRDPADAVGDAEALLSFVQFQFDAMFAKASCRSDEAANS